MNRKSCLVVIFIMAFMTMPCVAADGKNGEPAKRRSPVEKNESVLAVGTIEPMETVNVSARLAGEVVELGANGKKIDSGDNVQKNDILARLDDAAAKIRVEREEALCRRAEAELKIAEAQRTSQVEVKANTIEAAKASLQAAQASLKLAQLELEHTVIRSPISGVVIARHVNVGDYVKPGTSVFLLAGPLDKLQVWASVNENSIGRIHKGMTVHFSVDTFPGKKYLGKVSRINTNASLVNNVVTYTVVIEVDNKDHTLLPYLTANATFEAR